MGVVYLILRPKLKITQQINDKTILENKKLEEINTNLRMSRLDLDNEIAKLTNRRNDTIAEIDRVNSTLESTRYQAEATASIIYTKSMEAMQEHLSNAAEKESEKFRALKEEYDNQYLQLLEDGANAYNFVIAGYEEQIADLDQTLADLRSKTDAAIAANKRAFEEKEQQDYFRLQLSSTDIEEIKKLKSVLPYLRDSEPLNKVIYKVYYENPYTDLIGRVIGKETITGIYKITNIENNMCYIGQAVDISSRWKQHIKRGIGAETPTRNKLYPAMAKFGVENFTFEVVEKCQKEQLNEREQYWQDYFKAKEFGYSIK